jgi:hypothetical protein
MDLKFQYKSKYHLWNIFYKNKLIDWGARISKPIIFYNGFQHYIPTCYQGQQMWICTLLYLNILGTIDFNIEVNTNLSIVFALWIWDLLPNRGRLMLMKWHVSGYKFIVSLLPNTNKTTKNSLSFFTYLIPTWEICGFKVFFIKVPRRDNLKVCIDIPTNDKFVLQPFALTFVIII